MTELPAHTERGGGPSPVIEAAAWRVLEAGLEGRPSAFDPSVVAWTSDIASELLRRVAGGDQTSKDSFVAKLERQLAGASQEVVVLAAELLFLQGVPLSNLKPQTKLDRLRTVLGWAPRSVELPQWAVDALTSSGVFNGGAGFSIQIWQQLMWLCRFVVYWNSLDEGVRAHALGDPLEFARVTKATPQDWPSIRLSLNYLAWPGCHVPIVTSDHRRRIRDAFAHLLTDGASGNDDEAISHDLRRLESVVDHGESSGRVEWYREPFYQEWNPASVSSGTRAWLVRPKQGGPALVKQWIEDQYVSVAAVYLSEVSPGNDKTSVRDAVETGYKHVLYPQRIVLVNEYHDILSRMKTDDLMATVSEGQVFVGRVTGDAEYITGAETQISRPVAWSEGSTPKAQLPSGLQDLLDNQGTVVDITAGLDELNVLLPPAEDNADGGQVDRRETVVPPPLLDVIPMLPAVGTALASSLHMPVDSLQEIVDLLQVRQQIVLYGPPGTGKTFLARKLAEHLVGDDPGRAQLVQFHPSYAYEDFFEGYRPVEDSGQATFALRPGPLRLIASEAADNRGAPFILIIDEMNRANLAKVFGELYFLLEYRDESMRLQYQATEAFRLPKNLFIIGTMNTADRSIALVDAAIRRRFAFVELHPDAEPVKGVLASFLAANGQDGERAALLAALNSEIEDHDRDLKIGPSYLMKPDAAMPGGLERIWKYEILPLLEEHYYGRLTRDEVHARFGLDALRASLTPPVE